MNPSGTGGLFDDWYARRDDVAWGELLERLRPRFVWWCAAHMSAKLRAWIEPEDMAQVLLASIHGSRAQFQGGGLPQFLAWCFTIAEHRIQDAVDGMNAEKRTPPAIQIVSFSQTNPSGPARWAEFTRRVKEALERLEAPYRQVFALAVLQEMPLKSIAALLGTPEATIRTWKFRAIRMMREHLGGLEPLAEGLGGSPIEDGDETDGVPAGEPRRGPKGS